MRLVVRPPGVLAGAGHQCGALVASCDLPSTTLEAFHQAGSICRPGIETGGGGGKRREKRRQPDLGGEHRDGRRSARSLASTHCPQHLLRTLPATLVFHCCRVTSGSSISRDLTLKPPAADSGELTSMHPDRAPPYASRKCPRVTSLGRRHGPTHRRSRGGPGQQGKDAAIGTNASLSIRARVLRAHAGARGSVSPGSTIDTRRPEQGRQRRNGVVYGTRRSCGRLTTTFVLAPRFTLH